MNEYDKAIKTHPDVRAARWNELLVDICTIAAHSACVSAKLARAGFFLAKHSNNTPSVISRNVQVDIVVIGVNLNMIVISASQS